MEQSEYYKLNLVTGADLVNPLVQDKPNFETIDLVMHNNAIATVGTATQVKTETVHTLTRADSTPCFRFTALYDYANGDTFTVDGNVVTATLTNGQALPDKAFVVNTDVLCILNGAHLTIFAVSGSDEEAIEQLQEAVKTLQETTSGLTEDVTALEEVVGDSELLETSSKVVVGAINEVKGIADNKQAPLVNQVNIKSINGSSILGGGDLEVSGGVGYIDTSNVILSRTLVTGTITYTATENCWFNMNAYIATGTNLTVSINDVSIMSIANRFSTSYFFNEILPIPLSKGDTISLIPSATGGRGITYTVYGVK